MLRRIKYFFGSKQAVRAGKKPVSPEQAVMDYEKYKASGLAGSYEKGAMQAGTVLHVLLGNKGYKLTRDGRSRSSYFLPEVSILESEDGDRKQVEGNYLPGKEFYQ